MVTNLGAIVLSKLDDLLKMKDKTRLILTEGKISRRFDEYQCI